MPAILEQKIGPRGGPCADGWSSRSASRRPDRRRSLPACICRRRQPPGGPGLLDLHPGPRAPARRSHHPIGWSRAAIDRLATFDPADVRSRLERLPVGPWTAAEVARWPRGDADALSVGDYHPQPGRVRRRAARRRRGCSSLGRRGQRGRVQRLLELSGISAAVRATEAAARAEPSERLFGKLAARTGGLD